LANTPAGDRLKVSTPEPGLDRDEWQGELEALEPGLRDSPAEALPELLHLIERMLAARGLDPADLGSLDPEVRAELENARDVAVRVERGECDDPGDVASAVEGLRGIFEFVVTERSAP
jgi:hypothetical protein